MYVSTYHEVTMNLGAYEVSHVELIPEVERIMIQFEHVDFVCSLDHKFYMNKEWIKASDLQIGDFVGMESKKYEVLNICEYESGDVIKISVTEAHTYICEGILSHNKLPAIAPPEPYIPPDPPAIVANPPDPSIVAEIPPDPPNLPIVFEPEPWWSDIPVTPVIFGGFDGSGWYPIVIPEPVESIPIIESPNPDVLEPIHLDHQVQIESGGGGHGGGRGDYDYDSGRYYHRN